MSEFGYFNDQIGIGERCGTHPPACNASTDTERGPLTFVLKCANPKRRLEFTGTALRPRLIDFRSSGGRTEGILDLSSIASSRPMIVWQWRLGAKEMTRSCIGVSLWSFLVVAGCSTDTRPQDLRLRISAVGAQRRDRIVVRVTATNQSQESVLIDRELSAFMHWELSGVSAPILMWEKLANLEKPPESDFETRFVILKPGESIEHDFELTYLVRNCIVGHTTSGSKHVHGAIFYESVGRWRIPAAERQITISFAFALDPEGYGGFRSWFGHDAKERADLPYDTISNKLTISLR
jgi:hypothetical protein